MGDDSKINLLISNIVEEKCYSHCRLCLKYIEDISFITFQENVCSYSNHIIRLDEMFIKILGKDVYEEIPELNAICNKCVVKALEAFSFIELYETNTSKLNKCLDNLNESLDFDIEIIDQNLSLYLEFVGDESHMVFVPNHFIKSDEHKILHKCMVCEEGFHNINALKEHIKQDHGTCTCQKCKNSDLNTASFKCNKCSQYRCTAKSLQDHIETAHGTQHICKVCGKSYRVLHKLLAHENIHATNKYVCPKCGKVYITKEFYTKHTKLCQEDLIDPHPHRSQLEKNYFCQECGKGYSTPGGLQVHKRFVHGNAKPHVCDQCGKKFTAPCYLKSHMITHTRERNFSCSICNKKFVTKEALLYHVRRHTGEKPYSCTFCNERFVNASARAEHMKHKHIGPTLSCEHCSRKFVTNNILKIHMKKHHNPTHKLFIGRANIPPDVPGEHNMRVSISYGEKQL